MSRVTLHGQPVGRFRASWLLFKETYRFFKADSEMIWIPLIMGIANLLLFGLLITVFLFLVLGTGVPFASDEEFGIIDYAFIFCCYVIGAFTLALSEAAIAHTVYTRAHGGDATLSDSLKRAFSHSSSLFLWSLITSTVGLVLRMIAERSKLLGRIVILLAGAAWSVLTYFVVPAMVISDKSAFASIGTSTRVFKSVWGETLVSNVSVGLTFLLVHLVALVAFGGLLVLAISSGVTALSICIVVVYILFIIAVSLLQSAFSGILKTLLYIYASEGVVPQNFDQELLEKMLVQKYGTPMSSSTTQNQASNTTTYESQSPTYTDGQNNHL